MRIYKQTRGLLLQWISKLRLLDLKLSGATVGEDVRVFGRFSWVGPANNITIGVACTINEGVFINARDRITIGNNVHLSPGVQIHTGALEIDRKKRVHLQRTIIIEDDVWLASGVIVSNGVKIGRGSAVGANSVVTSEIPPFTFYAGVPARFIRNVTLEE